MPGPAATEPELHQACDSWSGLGQITAGMTRQGWDLQLSQHSQLGGGIQSERWVARYVSGMGHVIEGSAATGATPWRAVQQAAYQTVAGAPRFKP